MGWSVQELAEEIGSFRREVKGRVRKMLVSLSIGGSWQTTGHALFDPTKPETRQVENFPGIGISARPPDGGSAECIVVQVGGSNNPAIVATRDEATRSKAADDDAPDTTILYNSKARVVIRADGTIEIRGIPGVLPLQKLPRFEVYRTAEDTLINALRTFLVGLDTMVTAMSTDAALLGVAPNTYAAAGVLQPLFAVLFAAMGVFQAAAASYMSAVGKNE